MPSLHKAKLFLAKLGVAAKQQGRQQGDTAPLQLQASFDFERALARVEQRLTDLWLDARRRSRFLSTPTLPQSQAKGHDVQQPRAQPAQLQGVLGTNDLLRVSLQVEPAVLMQFAWVCASYCHLLNDVRRHSSCQA
jgi:hypothetical protein